MVVMGQTEDGVAMGATAAQAAPVAGEGMVAQG